MRLSLDSLIDVGIFRSVVVGISYLLLLIRLLNWNLFFLSITIFFLNRSLRAWLLFTFINQLMCLSLVILSIFISRYRLTYPLTLLMLQRYHKLKLFSPCPLSFPSNLQLWVSPRCHLCHCWCARLLWVRHLIHIASFSASTMLGAA